MGKQALPSSQIKKEKTNVPKKKSAKDAQTIPKRENTNGQ